MVLTLVEEQVMELLVKVLAVQRLVQVLLEKQVELLVVELLVAPH
jgi:hypothetical protein